MRYGKIVLPNKGEGICAAVHVDDVVDAMLIAGSNPSAIGQRFLISGPEPVTWGSFYEALAKAAGTKGPQYRPLSEIEKENKKLAKLRRFLLTPERSIRRVARVNLVKRSLRKALNLVPPGLRAELNDALYGPDSRRRGYVHMPDVGHARWLESRSTITSKKARAVLGYRPRVTLSDGMKLVQDSLASQRHQR